MNYNQANKHIRDERVEFLPDVHEYVVDGKRGYTSVTQLVSQYFSVFDARLWAERKATKNKTAEMILAEWDKKAEKARDLGSLMHHRIEQYYLGEELDANAASDAAFRHFLEFTKSHQLNPYRSEWVLFDEDLHIAGTLDFLAVNDKGEYEIYDWKRSTKVVSNDGCIIVSKRYCQQQYGLHPITHIPDTSFYHYTLQLSMYRRLLERKYGISPVAAHLGVFHPDLCRPFVVDVPYYRNEVDAILSQISKS